MLARGEGLTEEETELDKSRNFQERLVHCKVNRRKCRFVGFDGTISCTHLEYGAIAR